MVLIVGAGPMAVHYFKVLMAINEEIAVIGRGEETANEFLSLTGHKPEVGGIELWLENNHNYLPAHAIVCTPTETSFFIAKTLIKSGIKNVLLEKPGALKISEFIELQRLASISGCNVSIAYNRRFISTILKANEYIKADGGVKSFQFEFTEWGDVISKSRRNESVKRKWLLANSSHLIDLSFYLGGSPIELNARTTGGVDWHPSSSMFSGEGTTIQGGLFSYYANWSSPGRWGLELNTDNHRIVLSPLEEIKVFGARMKLVHQEGLSKIDLEFKPGLYRQVESFLGDKEGLCSLSEQVQNVSYYYKLAGYEND